MKDKIVVITGGLGQLGRRFSSALTELNAKVAVIDSGIDKAVASARVKEQNPAENLLFLHSDVTDKKSLEHALGEITGIWGPPHALINNAALDSPPDAPAEENGPFENYPESSWDKIMSVNVKGVFLCCQVIGGAMAKTGRGSIINIASIYGLVSPDQRLYAYRQETGMPFFKPAAYSTSKSALLNLTRYLATYWADKGIRVNTLTLGGVFNHQDEQFLKNYEPKVPLGRMANKNEYNGAVIFLISNASSYMTGANMIIDGGLTAW